YGSSAPSGDASGGQAIIVGPGYISWQYGRNGFAIQVSYLNGWPHASLTSYCAPGVTSLPVNHGIRYGATADAPPVTRDELPASGRDDHPPPPGRDRAGLHLLRCRRRADEG